MPGNRPAWFGPGAAGKGPATTAGTSPAAYRCTDGRKAALDLELVGITTTRPGKTGAVIANVARIYHATRGLVLPGDDPAAPGGGFQIVFCDLGTPNPAAGTQVYGKIRAGLTAAGIPASQIRFIHDATTDLRKATLFADCRAGKVAVLLGSTDKLGVGTNIQNRCTTVHHVDAPWRPADVEQREGRALRPGNLNPVVEVYRYVSERSFDSFYWQVLERKSRFTGQVLSGRPAGRDVDDIGDATLSYAEVKALATGNPLLLDLAEANAQVTRLRQLATAHTRATRRLTTSITGWQQQADTKHRHATAYDRIARQAASHPDQIWRDQEEHPIPDANVATALARLVTDAMAPGAAYLAVSWRGLQISFTAERAWRDITPVATISAGPASLPAELSAAWTAKGQHWRIEKAIRSAIADAPASTERLHREIADLRYRITDATRRISEPFPQAAELEAARTRRDTIEQDIRDAAAPPDASTTGPASQDESVADAGIRDEPALARMPDFVLTGTLAEEEITFVPAMISPQAAELAGDEIPAGSAQAGIPDELVSAPAAEFSVTTRASEGRHREPGAGAGEPPGAVATPDAAAGAGITPGAQATPLPPVTHPVFLARQDLVAEPLFALPAPAGNPAAGAAAGRSAARRRSARRSAVPTIALEDAAQPALFDLPPPAVEPRRPAAGDHNPARAPRK